MSIILQIISFISGIASVYFAGDRDIKTWVSGAIGSLALFILFAMNGNQGMSLVQLLYLYLSFAGYMEWSLKVKKPKYGILLPIVLTAISVLPVILIGSFDWSAGLLSIFATGFLIVKDKVAWPMYILSNLLTLVLCVQNDMWIVFGQYIIFITLSIIGFFKWK